MVQSFNSKMENMEVRRVEEVNSAYFNPFGMMHLGIGEEVYPRLQIHFDTEDCERLIFIDNNVSRKDVYQRGTVGALELSIITESIVKTNKTGSRYMGERTRIEIASFTPNI